MVAINSHRIIVGLSGGVDSAVAALLLKQQGWLVQGLFMKNWEEDDASGYCAAAADLAEAQTVARQLDIELLTVNFATEYWERVFEYFLAEHRIGRTPNPDVLCNSEIKFRAFLEYALAQGAAAIATGHYAKIDSTPQGSKLLLATDQNKDQTYFLHRLTQEQLGYSYFPVGGLTKQQVRHTAAAAGLANAERKDSTGICFIGERRFQTFLARYLPPQPGSIETPEGIAIGEHKGLMYYTIGQRQGLSIGGIKGMTEAPWFVAGKDLTRNVLIAVQGHHHPVLWNNSLNADNWHWINGKIPSDGDHYMARIRHRQPLQKCHIQQTGDKRYRIVFAQPQWAIAAGQYVVIYKAGECLGGGVIALHI